MGSSGFDLCGDSGELVPVVVGHMGRIVGRRPCASLQGAVRMSLIHTEQGLEYLNECKHLQRYKIRIDTLLFTEIFTAMLDLAAVTDIVQILCTYFMLLHIKLCNF